MDVEKLFAGIVCAVVAFEVCEHVIFPVLFRWKMRDRPPRTGLEALVGRRARVMDWDGRTGTVMVDGERWKASGSSSLAPGDQVRITEARSLTLTVASEEKETAA